MFNINTPKVNTPPSFKSLESSETARYITQYNTFLCVCVCVFYYKELGQVSLYLTWKKVRNKINKGENLQQRKVQQRREG